MNFSEPGLATTTAAAAAGSTPLHLAHTLFTDTHHLTNLSAFKRHLTAIHDASYLLLLPQTNPDEESHHAAETRRISTGPDGAAVLQATTLFLLNTCHHATIADVDVDNAAAMRSHHADIHEATGCILQELAREETRYMNNMTRLLASMKEKWKSELVATGSWHTTALRMGPTGIASAQALADLVGDRAAAPCHGRTTYLSEIARYWRKWGGEAAVYEEVWSYVAGRALVQE